MTAPDPGDVMKRYSSSMIMWSLDGGPLQPAENGEWVRFEDAKADRDRLAAANAALEAQVARLVVALEALRHAVCGETGFASCVRADSGKAYPWPALDEAEALVNAALAEVQADARREDGE